MPLVDELCVDDFGVVEFGVAVEVWFDEDALSWAVLCGVDDLTLYCGRTDMALAAPPGSLPMKSRSRT
jgi:hypothetical protein